MFGPSLFDRVLRVVKDWEPEKEYRDEGSYRDDLLDFLRDELNRPPPFALGPQKRVKVVRESGRHLCDIGVGEEVGIELKKDLRSLKQIHRLIGQLHDFLNEYDDLIVVLVGEVGDDAYEHLEDSIDRLVGETPLIGFGPRAPRIEIIDKSPEGEEEEEKPFSLF